MAFLYLAGSQNSFPICDGSSLYGVKHGGGVRLDHAVEHGFHYAAGNPIVVISAARLLDLVDRIRSQFWRIEEVSDVEPDATVAAVCRNSL